MGIDVTLVTPHMPRREDYEDFDSYMEDRDPYDSDDHYIREGYGGPGPHASQTLFPEAWDVGGGWGRDSKIEHPDERHPDWPEGVRAIWADETEDEGYWADQDGERVGYIAFEDGEAVHGDTGEPLEFVKTGEYYPWEGMWYHPQVLEKRVDEAVVDAKKRYPNRERLRKAHVGTIRGFVEKVRHYFDQDVEYRIRVSY